MMIRSRWNTPDGHLLVRGGDKVLFRPFSGSAPRLYKRAFLKDRDLKDKNSGKMDIRQPESGTAWHCPEAVMSKSKLNWLGRRQRMASEGTRRQLEIVRSPKRQEIGPDDFIEPSQQTNLFPSPRRGLLIFVHFPDVTEQEFRNTLVHAKPAHIFELRPAPRFDIGSLNRQSAFRLFSEQRANYIDLACFSMAYEDTDRIFMEFKTLVRTSHFSLERPVMILMTKSKSEKHLVNQISKYIGSLMPEALEIFEVPQFSRT